MITTATHTRRDRRGRVVEEKVKVVVKDAQPRQLCDYTDLRRLKHIAILRDGHLGDLVMLTPALRCLRKLCPDTVFDVYCNDKFLPIFYRSPHVGFSFSILNEQIYDMVIDLRSFVERSSDAWYVDRITLFGKAFGISVWNGEPELHTEPEGISLASAFLKTKGLEAGSPYAVIGPDASDPHRCIPDSLLGEFERKLTAAGITPITVGTVRGDKISIPTLVSLISGSRVVLCGDNALYHIAGAFKYRVKSYPIMTTVDPALRCCWYENCKPIVPALPCAPCNEKRLLPDSTPCCAVCWEALDAGAIVAKIAQENL